MQISNRTLKYKKGEAIHIKESKKGTFTAAAKKHGKSVQAFASQVLNNKNNYSTKMIKKAVFAKNAKTWKHEHGGLLRKYQAGAKLGEGNLSPEAWRKQNETLGYKPIPYLQTQGGAASKYPHYYDPKKYSINPDMSKSLDGKNPGWNIMDLVANKPIQMNALADNQMFSFQPVNKQSVINYAQKPVVAVQTNRQRIPTNDGFIFRYNDGRADEYFDPNGKPVQVLTREKGGLINGKKKIKKCSCGSLMYKKK